MYKDLTVDSSHQAQAMCCSIMSRLVFNYSKVSDSYLDGGWSDKADSYNIFHDLWIKLEGLQKGAAGIREGPLLPVLLQVINKDIVILLPVEKCNTNKNIVELDEKEESG